MGVDYPTVAAVCDENISVVKAWASPDRDHAIPAWAERRMRVELPALAAYIDRGMDQFDRDAAGPEVEATAFTTIGACARAVAGLSAILPNGVDEAEARRELPTLIEARERITETIDALQARATVTPIRRGA
jgi:hypothetical protein